MTFIKTVLAFLIIGLVSVNILSSQTGNDPSPGKMAGQVISPVKPPAAGLLFYLSADNDFTADFAAGGQAFPNFLKDVSIIPGGAAGKAIKAEDSQLLAYWAPGNIYAQRGTISFFWRPRYPIGKNPFPVFRVGYADHSSWDMVWLRIDYNGSGFDAFVTDIGLARTRLSYYPDKLPAPDQWIHFVLSWDETEGIRFYYNGMPAGKQTVNGAVFDAALDQFGPHSRIISPYQVQSAYSFMRGGDIDEIRIYDRMLSDEMVISLARGKAPADLQVLTRDLGNRKWRDEWWLRNGWNLPNPPPPVLPAEKSAVRKVEIHDAFDIKRWYWKANDGIRETTWPGVYNMSRLPGRYDYFVLPDWDCYSGSGQSVRFIMPDEKWNHIEIFGKAWGQITFESDTGRDLTFGIRRQDQVKSVHRPDRTLRGGAVRFDNALIEEPIGSFEVYYVSAGNYPAGRSEEVFSLTRAPEIFLNKSIDETASFIRGRFPADERTMMLATKGKTDQSVKPGRSPAGMLPIVHVLIPCTYRKNEGLDGIELRLPEMNVKPTHDGLYPMNIRIKDPLWLIRDMADFSFSVKPGESPVIWIDTRDRIIPEGSSLYLTISGAGYGLTEELLSGGQIRLVYKSREEARKEHEIDRLTQIRDIYAHIVEERPRSPRLNLFNRFMADCNDLLSVSPDHFIGQSYQYAVTGRGKPGFEIPSAPSGIPEWAFLQTEYMRLLERMIMFYINERQISNGEFGGGLSDDGDLTNMWPGIAFIGIDPDKILRSLELHMSAYYDQERPARDAPLRQRSLPLFTNGLSTIFTDELHTLEEGIQVVAQMQLLDYGNPLHHERAMETTLRLYNDITGINSAGHRHFKTRYYGGMRIAEEDPWTWSVNRSYLILHPAYLLAAYNGSRKAVELITGLADGILSHKRGDRFYTDINFLSDSVREDTGMATGDVPWHLMTAAYKLTGERKYIEGSPVAEPERRVFDEKLISARYRDEITSLAIREYINTEGSIWIDRLSPFNPLIQRDRLGGVALTRTSMLYPQHRISWKFSDPSNFDDVAIFVPDTGAEEIRVIAFNVTGLQVTGSMTLWDIKPGRWKISRGIDSDNDQVIDTGGSTETVDIERGSKISLTFAPMRYNIISLELVQPSGKDYSSLPDLAFGKDDIYISPGIMRIRIHNIGSALSPPTVLELRDKKDSLMVRAAVPPIEPPLDLIPKWKEVIIKIPEGSDFQGMTLTIDPENKVTEITKLNSGLILN